MLTVSSYRSPKTEFRMSSIAGYGRFAKEAIKKDEIVAIRSGHIVNGKKLLENAKVVNGSEHQIDNDFYLVPLEGVLKVRSDDLCAEFCYKQLKIFSHIK